LERRAPGRLVQGRRLRGRTQHSPEHLGCEATGDGVVLADVETPEELDGSGRSRAGRDRRIRPRRARPRYLRAQRDPGAVGERWLRSRYQPSRLAEGGQCSLPAEGAEYDHRPQGRPQQLQLPHEPRPARVSLRGCRLVGGRAQCTGEVIRTPYSSSPSSALTEVPPDASPTSCSAA
jgi:hypothetical protein